MQSSLSVFHTQIEKTAKYSEETLTLLHKDHIDDTKKDESHKNQNKSWILIIFGISGMTALIYEIIWIRPLSLVFGTTIYAVSTIVASFIFGLSVGSWIAGRYTDKMKNPLKYFAFVHIGIAFFGLLLLPIFSTLPSLYLEIYKATFPERNLFMFTQILMSMSMISIPAALMGSTLPIMMRIYSKKFSTIGNDVGKLDAANSMGAMFGTLAAGFLLIPLLGIETSIIITASINVGIGISILMVKKFLKYRYLAAVIVIAILFFLIVPNYDSHAMNFGMFYLATPLVDMEAINSYLDIEQVLFFKESLYSSVMVSAFEDQKILKIHGKTQCSNMKLAVSGLHNLALFPYELFEYNYGKPKNGLNIGLGCGQTSKWLSERVQTTTLEIDPVIVEASQFFYDRIDHNLVIDDARNWLFRNDEKFDIITTEPSDPFQNQGALFTKEFFSLLNNRLSENGIVSQWVPIYEMTFDDLNIFYNTFHSVFPYVYVYEMEEKDITQLVFVGSQKELKIKDNPQYLKSYLEIPVVETLLNVDDRPLIEFTSALNYKNPNQMEELMRIVADWLQLDPEKLAGTSFGVDP